MPRIKLKELSEHKEDLPTYFTKDLPKYFLLEPSSEYDDFYHLYKFSSEKECMDFFTSHCYSQPNKFIFIKGSEMQLGLVEKPCKK